LKRYFPFPSAKPVILHSYLYLSAKATIPFGLALARTLSVGQQNINPSPQRPVPASLFCISAVKGKEVERVCKRTVSQVGLYSPSQVHTLTRHQQALSD
jgi:hypothetical protein